MTRRQLLARKRLRLALVVVLTLFFLFGARLFQIQAFDTSAYAALAQAKGMLSTIDPAQRGQIVDRNGVELAGSENAATLVADPKQTAPDAPQLARVLTGVLGDKVDYFELIDKLRTPNSRFVYLVKKLPAPEANDVFVAIAAANKERKPDQKMVGIFMQKEHIRDYPGGSLAANLLGFTNDNGDGVGGLEQQYNGVLKGKDGTSTYEVSPAGQRIPMADSKVVPMTPGDTINTTIDRDLQWYSDQRLTDAVHSSGADWGLAITMDVRTCQIVQLSQSPTFDAGTRQNMDDQHTVARAWQNVYEPGSVMKPITFAALAQEGKVEPDTPIVVPGHMTVDGFKIGDYWEHGTLHLTAAGVIAQSSNMGTVVASQQLTDRQMYDYFSKFGLGKLTGAGLPGESRGILRKPEGWTQSTHATMAFGQGVSVTGLQMVRAINTIANDGTMCDPSVVTGTTDPAGHTTAVRPAASHSVISPAAARTVTRMMEAVTAPDGTAPAAAIKGYRVAGKTGTAWRVDPNTGRYVRHQNTVSFVGFAPADKPRLITYVVLDRVGGNAGGGITAAPVFHDIMSMALERFGVTPTGSLPPKLAHTW